MEAGRLPREADLAPAPKSEEPSQGSTAGWTPADPGPLGLAGFATTTFALSLINANLVAATALPVVAMMALTFGGIAQLVAGIWEFRTGNTFGAVAFTAYGTFWISFFFVVQIGLPAIPKTEVGSAVGLYLWAWGLFTVYMFIASLRTTGAVAVVLLLLTITFIVLGIGWSALTGTTNATNGTIKLGGYIGIVTAVAAWYTSMAGVVNGTWGRDVFPVFPLSR
jgi:succinate-acetate transporter protein